MEFLVAQLLNGLVYGMLQLLVSLAHGLFSILLVEQNPAHRARGRRPASCDEQG